MTKKKTNFTCISIIEILDICADICSSEHLLQEEKDIVRDFYFDLIMINFNLQDRLKKEQN